MVRMMATPTVTVVPIAPAHRASRSRRPHDATANARQVSSGVPPRAAATARKGKGLDPARGVQDVAELDARVRELSRELAYAEEGERVRLAQELHDELGAHLTAARLAAARIETWLPADAPSACAQALAALCAALDSVCDASRWLVDERHAPQLDGGLVPALSRWTTQFSARTQLRTSFVCAADVRLTQLTRDATHAIYRVAQEALNNVAKHANASGVMLSLACDANTLVLEVRDDGIGLARGVRAKPGHHGLSGMRARCEAFGGTLRLAGGSGRGGDRGTTITASFAWKALTDSASKRGTRGMRADARQS